MARMSITSGRIRANARERSRMHNLNRAIDRLRSFIPLSGDFQSFDVIPSTSISLSSASTFPSSTSSPSSSLNTTCAASPTNGASNKFTIRTKLSKIETLRLARNYLVFLTEMNNSHVQQNRIIIGQILGYGLGQHSLNQIAALLNLEGSVRMLSQTPESVKVLFKNYCGTCDNSQEYSDLPEKPDIDCDLQPPAQMNSIIYQQEYSYEPVDFW